jgi:hypothetical protein
MKERERKSERMKEKGKRGILQTQKKSYQAKKRGGETGALYADRPTNRRM